MLESEGYESTPLIEITREIAPLFGRTNSQGVRAFVKNWLISEQRRFLRLTNLQITSFQSMRQGEEEDFWRQWNAFIRESGVNPFLLAGFVEFYMGDARSRDWTPQLLVMREGARVVGGAPLMTHGIMGARTATFMMPKPYGMDFVAEPAHREEFVRKALKFVLEDLKCQFVDVTLPGESQNLVQLRDISGGSSLGLRYIPLRDETREHTVLKVMGTWSEFQEGRGGNFIHYFRRAQHKLDRAGSWRARSIPMDGLEAEEAVKAIEKNSWKETWRKEVGMKVDPSLGVFFAYRNSSFTDGYYPLLWLLELNGEPIAYMISANLNSVSLLCKTSFDQRFAKMSPGDYIQNVAMGRLYDSGEVSRIDFLTGLNYHRRWTSYRETRVRVVISRTIPGISSLIIALGRNKRVHNAYKRIRGRGGSP